MGEHALFSSGMLGAFLWLMGAVATDMVAIYALVRCQGFRLSFWTYLSIAMIFLSFMCMRRVVLVIPLGVAYALWCVFGIFGTIIMGLVAFRQRLSGQSLIGIVLLTTGIICMALS